MTILICIRYKQFNRIFYIINTIHIIYIYTHSFIYIYIYIYIYIHIYLIYIYIPIFDQNIIIKQNYQIYMIN